MWNARFGTNYYFWTILSVLFFTLLGFWNPFERGGKGADAFWNTICGGHVHPIAIIIYVTPFLILSVLFAWFVQAIGVVIMASTLRRTQINQSMSR